MRKLSLALTGAAVMSLLLVSVETPALALGGCGFNGHRNFYGRCVFGGQNQNFCLRRTGHYATRMPNGTFRCL